MSVADTGSKSLRGSLVPREKEAPTVGEHNVEQYDETKYQRFMKALLDDLRALAFMLEEGQVESGVRRIGAEQEMFLVDGAMRPAPISVEVLNQSNDPRLTTEIARFNLEANLTPRVLTSRCLQQMEAELRELIAKARAGAKTFEADVLLSGILPTLNQSDLTLDNLTPSPRYEQLNREVIRSRGGPLSMYIKGLDEIHLLHDNIMMESCNTSFQVHFQTNPNDFVRDYNLAQAITAPLLAVAVNSPLLFGKRLWRETRVALFQHSTDARSRPQLARSQPARVSFGDKWLQQSVIALFHDQISRFRPIMISQPDEDPFHVLARGEVPKLSALCMHNGTVWRWNRACYGVHNGKAHLRIENRALPSGPTLVDEIANTAFFAGLMLALPEEYGDVAKRMAFDEAKGNFFRAARHGLDAQFNWVDGETYSASALILDHLLPLARAGLKSAKVAAEDADKYLDIIEERARERQTGARWILHSFDALAGVPNELRQRRLAATMLEYQKNERPVHKWPTAKITAGDDWENGYRTIGQFMTTDLFTVRPDDLIDLAASLMDWRHIRHVPVEDDRGRLVGLITHRNLLHLVSNGMRKENVTVRDVMVPNPVTVSSLTPTLDAIQTMRERRIGCLPVVDADQLVGIITSYDFLEASVRLFREHLERPAPVANGRALAHTA
jgi:CBS domain-containing protein/gamma-glutamyl:cysteine ligase YbdK (ATP-grasp superfamily)